MKHITLKTDRQMVYDEVNRMTDYVVSKSKELDERSRERMLASEEELWDLGRFWDEAANGAIERFRYILAEDRSGGDFEVTLNVGDGFNEALLSSMRRNMTSYFVNYMLGLWYQMLGEERFQIHLEQGVVAIETVLRLIATRHRPKRIGLKPF